jgi:hypothetical protein
MGVMPCLRERCNQILCHIYSREFGYICTECFEELVDYCLEHGVSRATIKRFLCTEKGSMQSERQRVIDDLHEFYEDCEDPMA